MSATEPQQGREASTGDADQLGWIVAPIVHLESITGPTVPPPWYSSGGLTRWLREPERLSSLQWHQDSSGALFVWTTLNQRRSFGTLPDGREPALDLGPRPWPVSSDAPARRELGLRDRAALLRSLRPLALGKQLSGRELGSLLARARSAQVGARHLVAVTQPRVIVVATQHSLDVRAVIAAARATGIPSVYVPHAPVNDVPAYRDVPCDLAALRGPREKEYYERLGGDGARIQVVGDPSMPDVASAPDGPIVVAPSPWPRDQVVHFLEGVATAIEGPFVVCPHPRSDARLLRSLLPSRARLEVGRRTSDVLAQGARAVIQHSSGVAIEAMRFGIPVIDLVLDDRAPSYPAIATPYAELVSTAADLAAVLARLDERSRHASARALRDWAREWVAEVGQPAEQRLAALLADDIPVTGPLVDGWAGWRTKPAAIRGEGSP